MIKALVFAGILISLSTCTYKAMDPNVCFADNVLPIFVSKCSMSGCHTSGSKHRTDCTTYDGIMTKVVPRHPLRSEMYTRIAGFGADMPPKRNTQLTSQEIFYIKAWISMGAANSSNCSGCDTTLFKFSADIQPIINTWCVGCHSASSSGGSFDLSTYTGVVSSIAGNKLIGCITHSPGHNAMPIGASQLSACSISKIQSWINVGFPND